jgi:ribosomal protein S12 methylthiotransferase accessory factor
MLDVATLLDPRSGLVTELDVRRPSRDDIPLWRAFASLDCEHSRAPAGALALLPCTTGACSTTRAQAVVRAAGEAVERLALHGAGQQEATRAQLGERALDFCAPDVGLAADPGERALRWYPATRLSDGVGRLVPGGLVEFPAAAEDREGFDPGPSGAAAGLGRDAALRGALLETVERDAVIVAWARQQRLGRIDVDAVLADARWDAEWAELERSVRLARDAGFTPVFAQIPLGIAGLTCVVGGVRSPGDHHDLLALGVKVSSHPARAACGALHESFQLQAALRLFESPDAHDAVVTDDTERVRFLASRTGVDALEAWLADPVDCPFPGAPTRRDWAVEDLAAELIADGLDPYVVDLTDQLPEKVRQQGWSVVKVIPVGYQPLRIDERHTFGWNHTRLGTAQARTGVPVRRTDPEPFELPHPLP